MGEVSGRGRFSLFQIALRCPYELADEVSQYATSKGALQFAVDRPLPKALVKKLIAIRKRQAFGR
jgi:hypothetical protein